MHQVLKDFSGFAEGDYDISEIFFSRTDPRGVILSGNHVFKRVSGHEWDSLLKAPHNIIRHPDMPKAVFHLFWETVGKGQPIGAYVKNRSKNGAHYWVFALAMPIEEGYLSVRIKPTSALLSVIESEYQNLKKYEVSERLTPEASQARVLKRLQELGFSSYQKFMNQALFAEWSARETRLMRELDLVKSLKMMSDLGAGLIEESKVIMLTLKNNRYLPLNLEVGSAKLGTEGDSISVVALQYQNAIDEVQEQMAGFGKRVETVLSQLEDSQFLICASQLMTEVYQAFRTETIDCEAINQELEMKLLSEKAILDQMKAKSGLLEIESTLKTFQKACEEMRALLLRLEIVRLTGKMESSRLGEKASAFEDLMKQLKNFQGTLLVAIERMDQGTYQLKNTSNTMLSNTMFKAKKN